MLKLNAKLNSENIKTSMFYEPDINQNTAFAVEPSERAARLLSSLPLALKNVGTGIKK